jgi:hypothetical protein
MIIEPTVTQTLIQVAANYVPLDQMAYVPMDVFQQYMWVQMIIDGGLGLLFGWVGHIWYLKRKARIEGRTLISTGVMKK